MDFLPVTLSELVQQFGGQLQAWPDTATIPGQVRLVGFQTLESASPQHLSFFTNPKYKAGLLATQAAVVLLRQRDQAALMQALIDRPAHNPLVLWWVDDAYLQYALIQQWWVSVSKPTAPAGVHPSAVVHPSAQVHPSASVGPNAVVGAHSMVAEGVVLSAGVVLGQGVQVGAASLLHANVTVYDECVIGAQCILHSGCVIGADGFGFAPHKGTWVKIPQVGRVVLGDQVEVGANTTIDRGALDDTLIGVGVKLDNQIMVAHNVRVGDHTAMAGCVGIAGSTKIGARCTIGGAANIFGHLSIADGTHVSGCTTVISSITEPGAYTGFYPMDTHKAWEKSAASVRQLVNLRAKVRALEKTLHQQETEQGADLSTPPPNNT